MLRPAVDMMEALRLTRQGKLAEAMAVLRGAQPVEEAATRQKGSGEAPVIDMVPPSANTEGAWTAPRTGADHEARPAPAGRTMEALGGGFLERLLNPKSRTPPPAPRTGATFESHEFVNEAGSRTYKLYVPSRYEGKALPLVVMLHGCTQSPDDFAAGTRMNECAEEQTFLVAYPAQSKSANASRCWNWFNGSEQRRGLGEPSLIAGITRQVMRDYPVETGRVYVAGLSAGGAAAAILGTTYPDLYAAVGVHSGLPCGAANDLPSAFAAMRHGGRGKTRTTLPTIVFHGDADKTVSPVNGDLIMDQATPAANLETTILHGTSDGGVGYVRTTKSDRTGRPLVEQWVLEGAGHAWSGGSSAGSFTDPRGPDASREMIRFFLHHQVAT